MFPLAHVWYSTPQDFLLYYTYAFHALFLADSSYYLMALYYNLRVR